MIDIISFKGSELRQTYFEQMLLHGLNKILNMNQR